MFTSSKIADASLRLALFVCTVISLGIEGHLRASNYDTARVNVGIAASTIGLVFSVFIPWIGLFVEAIYIIPVLLVLDFISFALYLSASAALTNNRGICHERGLCGQYRAGIAFLYMDWIFLLFAMGLLVYQLISGGIGGSGGSGGLGFGGASRSARYDYKTRRPASSYPAQTQNNGFADQAVVDEPAQTGGQPVATQV